MGKPNKKFIVVHGIYEQGSDQPVVEHRFFGDTLEKAIAVYKAHRKTDEFLRSCDETGQWIAPGGRPHVICRSFVRVITPYNSKPFPIIAEKVG